RTRYYVSVELDAADLMIEIVTLRSARRGRLRGPRLHHVRVLRSVDEHLRVIAAEPSLDRGHAAGAVARAPEQLARPGVTARRVDVVVVAVGGAQLAARVGAYLHARRRR